MSNATATRDRVVLTSGEALDVCGTTDGGVQTDAGTHGWDEVEAFRCYSEKHGAWFSIPVA